MQPRRAVLDANVLFSGVTRHILLALAAEPTLVYIATWSRRILQELERNIRRHWNLGPRELARLLDDIRGSCPDAVVDPPVELVRLMPNHDKDRHVLATAVATRAEVVVTNNVRDFRGADAWRVRVQTPDDFLCDLYRDEPDKVKAAMVALVGRLSNPTSLQELADRCALAGLRRFAVLLRETT